MMPDSPEFPLKVFYDGSCTVCAAEMAAYRRKQQGSRLEFIDISCPESAAEPYGIPRDALMYELHAIDRRGRVYRGIGAFEAIWHAFPALSRYGLLGFLIGLPGVNYLARCAYRGFARIRKYLPKSRHACNGTTCGCDGDSSR
jgi:predicted DCC family thiol-disulfide oxidoreductase YuxK